MKSEVLRVTHELQAMKDKIKENTEKIKVNKTLPYLVSNVIEVWSCCSRLCPCKPMKEGMGLMMQEKHVCIRCGKRIFICIYFLSVMRLTTTMVWTGVFCLFTHPRYDGKQPNGRGHRKFSCGKQC